MPSDFDQHLYDETLACRPVGAPESYREGYRDAADFAAKIAASRQSAVSDEALLELWYDTYWNSRETDHEKSALLAMAAVRAALTPVQVPEGWELVALDKCHDGYTCLLLVASLRLPPTHDPYAMGKGPTPEAALAEAVKQAREDGK